MFRRYLCFVCCTFVVWQQCHQSQFGTNRQSDPYMPEHQQARQSTEGGLTCGFDLVDKSMYVNKQPFLPTYLLSVNIDEFINFVQLVEFVGGNLEMVLNFQSPFYTCIFNNSDIVNQLSATPRVVVFTRRSTSKNIDKYHKYRLLHRFFERLLSESEHYLRVPRQVL